MPLFSFICDKCEVTLDVLGGVDMRNAPQVCPRGHRMRRHFTPPVIARTTRGGNLIFSMSNSKWKGNRKPRTISRGNGLGGRRPFNPEVKAMMRAAFAKKQTQLETMKAVDDKKARYLKHGNAR